MKIMHILKGEFLYFVDRKTDVDDYKILLLEFESRSNRTIIEIGLFNCKDDPKANMQVATLKFGERITVFHPALTINPLKRNGKGINFAVGATAFYRLECDAERKKHHSTLGNGNRGLRK